MKLFFLLLLSSFTCMLKAQTVFSTNENEDAAIQITTHETLIQEQNIEAKKAIDLATELHTIFIFPNPVTDYILHVHPVNTTVFSYQITRATGEIVEIENLIGRDDFEVMSLSGLEGGTYYISFVTDYGVITKSFVLLD